MASPARRRTQAVQDRVGLTGWMEYFAGHTVEPPPPLIRTAVTAHERHADDQQVGIPLLEHAQSASETMGFGAYQPLFLAYLGEAYVLADRLEDALEFAGRALSLARERGQRSYEAWALRLLGEVTARRDPPEHADGHYRDALALAEELGMRPLAAHCYLSLGKLYRRQGNPQEAQEHLTTATTMYREMDMPFWLEKAEAEMKDLA